MLEGTYPVVRAGPPVPSNIIQPGVFSMPPGTERYVVQGAGAEVYQFYIDMQVLLLQMYCWILACLCCWVYP